MKRSKRSRIIGLSLVVVVMSAALLSPTSTLGGFNNGTSFCSTTATPIIIQFTTGPFGGDPFPFDPSGDTRVGASALIGANFLAFSNFPSLISTRGCTSGSGDGCIGGNAGERRNLWMRAIPSCTGTLTVRELGYNELNPSCGASNRWIVIHLSGTTNSCAGPTQCPSMPAPASNSMDMAKSVSTSVTAGSVYFIEIGLDDCDCFGYGQYRVSFECQ